MWIHHDQAIWDIESREHKTEHQFVPYFDITTIQDVRMFLLEHELNKQKEGEPSLQENIEDLLKVTNENTK